MRASAKQLKMKGADLRPKGRTRSIHAKEVLVRGMDWAESEGALDIYLHHQSSSTKSHQGVYGVLDGGIV